MAEFRHTQPLSLPSSVEFKEAERNTPTSQLQAVGAAIAICLGMYVVMFFSVLGVALWIDWSPAWKPALGISGIFTAVLAVYWAFSGTESIMWQVEKITGRDINNDDSIGQPLQPSHHLFIEAQKADGSNGIVLADLPGPLEVKRAWIKAACGRQSLAIELWGPAFGDTVTPKGNTLSTYTVFKKILSDRKWIIDRGSHGIILSNEGKRILGNALEQMETMALPSGEEDYE